ncbi:MULTISPECIES: c-type cytochrome [Helicobacter]|uniref:C-type cytochrome n=1 Tax=Helicobacter ibis TaxID=2962633 RepID=A0ABT4VGV8_9HELI|nr:MULTISPECIES: c-type cytochrome [Helicobacter]MDA3967637.1 c-type cytochrome [Helicobacter sp. WB40]MDA3969355.1 c-type cytochrome [Helicobacter ibis]
MKKLLIATLLSMNLISANECVCFELKGEFGEEIREILKKYSKNLGSKDIKIVRENDDLTPQEKSFVDSLLGTGNPTSTRAYQANKENGEKLYKRDCASCHGQKAETSVATRKPINTWKASDIVDELRTYQNQTFEGQSRFVKNQIAQRYSKDDMRDIAYFIESLR